MHKRTVFDISTGLSVEVEDEAPPIYVPEKITPRQLRLILNAYGLLDDVEALVAQQDRAIQIAFSHALDFRRDDQLLNMLAQWMAPPVTQEQIDQMFVEAESL